MGQFVHDREHRRRMLGDALMVTGRLCIAALFIAGAVQKLLAPDATAQLLADHGWPDLLVWPALVFNAGGAVFLMFGIWLAPTAFALALYCMLTSIFHYIPDDPWQMSIFVKNWAIAGGLLVLCAAELRNPQG